MWLCVGELLTGALGKGDDVLEAEIHRERVTEPAADALCEAKAGDSAVSPCGSLAVKTSATLFKQLDLEFNQVPSLSSSTWRYLTGMMFALDRERGEVHGGQRVRACGTGAESAKGEL